MKRIHRITKWITPIIGAALITGLVIGINIEKEYDPVIGGFLANEANKANTDSGGEEGEKNNGGKLCTELLEEGIVLLKNENHALPLSHNKKVNIFGYGATEEVDLRNLTPINLSIYCKHLKMKNMNIIKI